MNPFVERLRRSATGFYDVVTIYLGDRLGYYRALAAVVSMTSTELSERTATAERYAREWLEQQAASGILEVARPSADPLARRYRLPPGHVEVLLDRNSLDYLAPMPRSLARDVRYLPAVLEAFRTGAGLEGESYAESDLDELAEDNRPAFLVRLGREWLPAVPAVHERLLAEPPARIADIGCGTGWSAIAMAQAYPAARIDGFDLDETRIAMARRNAADAGVTDRVRFEVRDAAHVADGGSYDLVTAFETVHDMSRPVDVLRAVRVALGADGAMLIADERVAETFTAPAGEIEQLLYGASVLSCLPGGMTGPDPAGTGAVMRPATLRRYAEEAGFRGFEILPIDYELWRFYLLRP